MPTYLYCLLKPAADPREVRGIAGEPVRTLTVGNLGTWIGDVPKPPRVSVEAAAAHDAVIQAALAHAEAVVPARFGQIMADDDAWRTRLQPRIADLEKALDRVTGMVEMAFVAQMAGPEGSDVDPPHTSGRAYLEGLREQQRREERWRADADQLRQRVRDRLGAVARDERVVMRAATRVMTVSHLVARADVATYRKRLTGMPAEGTLETVVVGPSPPGSFVTVEA